MSGLMGQQGQQPFDEGAFAQALQQAALFGASQGDPMSRMSRDAAQRQAANYQANKWEWDKLLASGQDLPTEDMSKPAWQRASRTFQVPGQGSMNMMGGLMGQQTGQMMPNYFSLPQFGLTPQSVNPNYAQDIRNIFQQYGPMGLMGLF